jgi:hypothetical protein
MPSSQELRLRGGVVAAQQPDPAATRGQVADATWGSAVRAGWTDQHLAEAFGYLGLAVFTSCFLPYADTGLDVPAAGTV